MRGKVKLLAKYILHRSHKQQKMLRWTTWITMDIQGGENHPVAGRYSPANSKCQRPKISRKRSKNAVQNFLDVLEG